MKLLKILAFGAIIALTVSLTAPLARAGYGKASSPEAQMKFGVDMARRGLWSEALFRFQQAERLDPNNPRILNNIAVAYEATGRFEEALEVYRKALESHPGDRELRRNFTRFIEFYQSYKPEGEGDGGGGEGAGTADDDGGGGGED